MSEPARGVRFVAIVDDVDAVTEAWRVVTPLRDRNRPITRPRPPWGSQA